MKPKMLHGIPDELWAEMKKTAKEKGLLFSPFVVSCLTRGFEQFCSTTDNQVGVETPTVSKLHPVEPELVN